MFNPILKENVHGQKHTGWCVVAELELPNFGKPKYLAQMDGIDTKFQ